MNSLAKAVVRKSALVAGVAALLFVLNLRVHAAVDAFLKFDDIQGESKDAAHLGWIPITRVVAGDLNGDAMADRESSAPSVSELTVRKAGGDQKAANIGSQSSGAGAGKSTSPTTMVRESPTKTSTGMTTMAQSGQASVIAPRDASSGMATGKRMHKPFVITKEIDKSSPLLMQACASGTHFKTAEVELGGIQYKLYDVVISSLQKSSGKESPTETLTLNFTKIEFKYQPQDRK